MPDGSCLGPQPELVDDAVAGVLCDTCAMMRLYLHQNRLHDPEKAKIVLGQMRRNQMRVNFIGDLVRSSTPITGARVQRIVSEKAEQSVRALLQRCIRMAGKPPARYSFLVCGSIARREAVTFSDVDAVMLIDSDDPQVRKYFVDMATKMQQILFESGGQWSQFKFCPGGLSPIMLCGTPRALLDQVEDKVRKGDAHLLAALQSRFVEGDQELALEYEELCLERMRRPSGERRSDALEDLRRHLAKRDRHFRDEGWAMPEDDDLMVNIKSQLYRPVHMIVGALAEFYGVQAVATREQILALVEADHMSLRVANFLFNVLDDVAKLRVGLHLEANTEYEMVRMRELRRGEVYGDDEQDQEMAQKSPLADRWRKSAVLACLDRVRLLWEMAEEFLAQKSGQRNQQSRDNPFNAALMPPERFYDATQLHKARIGWALAHPRTQHPLGRLYDELVRYHDTPKAMVPTRHAILRTLVEVGEAYLGGKMKKLSKKDRKKGRSTVVRSLKVQAVADLVAQAKERLAREERSMRELGDQTDSNTKGRHARVHRGLRYERAAKPGGMAVTGADLLRAAQRGDLGQVELSDMERDPVGDLYALRKLLTTVTDDDLQRAGVRKLEYSDDNQRRQYAIEVTAELLRWQRDGSSVDTLATVRGDPPRTALYAMDLHGRLFARNFDSQDQRGVFQHSSFLAGSDTLCAGTIKVAAGRLIEISNLSGHYIPGPENLLDACWALLDAGYDSEGAYALIFAPDNPLVVQDRQRTGYFRVPLAHFALTDGDPPDLVSFEVCAPHNAQDGLFVYTDPKAAFAAGAFPEGKDPPRNRQRSGSEPPPVVNAPQTETRQPLIGRRRSTGGPPPRPRWGQ